MSAKILVRTAAGVLQEFPLASSVRVGSGSPSELVIEGDGVLPEHAKVGVAAQGCWIETVGGSRVSVNGEPADRRALRHLDVITLGEHVHAIYVTSHVALPHASRTGKQISATKTSIGVPISPVFTPPVDDPAPASPATSIGLRGVPAVMPALSSSNRTVAGLPLSALSPPAFEAPPAQTSRISPIGSPPPSLGQTADPIRSIRLTGTAGVFDLPLGVSVIGRGSQATVRIDSVKVSRAHAVIVASPEEVTIEDQGSVNGTAVNGVRIQGRQGLADGDRVSLGSLELRVNFIRQGAE